MNKAIPSSFELMGTTWTVVWDNEKMNDKQSYGESEYSFNTITMSTLHGAKPLSDDRIQACFYHELVHAILDTMHEHELSNNETFVNTFGNLLHQAQKSAKYE